MQDGGVYLIRVGKGGGGAGADVPEAVFEKITVQFVSAEEVRRTLEQNRTVQRQLMDASRRAGMAERNDGRGIRGTIDVGVNRRSAIGLIGARDPARAEAVAGRAEASLSTISFERPGIDR